MKLEKLTVNHFQSLKEVMFDFPSGLVLIDGWNEDLQTHNGVGKSALLNAITYAIYGKVPKNITLGNLMMDGMPSMDTKIHLNVNDKEIVICRSRTEKKGGMWISVNGEQIQGLAKDLEEKIPELIGLTFNQFVQVVYVFQGANNRFVNLNDTDKKKFLSALLNLEAYDKAYKVAHSQITQLDLDMSRLEGSIESSKSEIIRIEEQREDAAKRMKEFRSELVEEAEVLNRKVDELKENIDSLKQQKREAKNSTTLAELQREKVNIEEKIQVIEEVKARIAKTDASIESAEKTLKSYKNQLKNFNKACDKCGQDLPEHSVSKHYNDLEDHANMEQETIKKLADTRTALNNLLSKEPILKEKYTTVLEQIAEEKSNGPEKYDAEINSYENQLKAISDQFKIKQDQLKLIEKEEKKWVKLLVEAKDNLKNNESTLKTKLNDKRVMSDVKKVFSPTGVKAFVFDGIIQQLNQSIEKYLNPLSSDAIRFELFSDDSKGKFGEICEYLGVRRDISSLSGGEFRRLSLAIDLALADVVCSRMSVYPNVMFIDEGFEGLDVAGRESVMDLLQEMISEKDAIYVVDHASECKSAFAQTFKLVKQNGETRREL